MISDVSWTYSNKNDKLTILREECGRLQERLDRQQTAHYRLLAHLGLTEVPGPVIVAVPASDVLGAPR